MSQIEALSEPTEIDGPLPVEDYRAISPLAITALGLGLLSVIAIFSPLLGFIPLAAMALGCYALRQISVDSERLSGRWMAVASLVLAPLFLGWGMSREFSRREQVYRHAREFADDWLGILNRKETYLAHQLKVPSKKRLDLHLNLEVAYQANETTTMDLNGFLGVSPVKEILAAAPNVRFQFEEFSYHNHSGLTDIVVMQYIYETPSSGKKRFWITAERTYSNYTGRSDWRISETSIYKPHNN
jgi:hypothetical protein